MPDQKDFFLGNGEMRESKMTKPLPIEASATVYASPTAQLFYHLGKDCPCFRDGGANELQALTQELAKQRHLQPCYFCACEPPPPLSLKERAIELVEGTWRWLLLPASLVAGGVVLIIHFHIGWPAMLLISVRLGTGLAFAPHSPV